MAKENQQESTNQPSTDPFLQLTETQWRFVTAMVENPKFTKKEAAEHIGVEANTVYKWPDYVKEAVLLSRQDIHNAALGMRRQAVLKAIAVKLALLDSDDEGIRSKAATEIIEWELGKALQRSDMTSKGEALKGYVLVSPDDWPDDDG